MANSWPYNTARWQRLRRVQLASAPLCKYCLELGQTTAATDVDHIIPVRRDPELVFQQSNLQSLCKPCHSGIKQSEDRTGQRRGCDNKGIPFKGWA